MYFHYNSSSGSLLKFWGCRLWKKVGLKATCDSKNCSKSRLWHVLFMGKKSTNGSEDKKPEQKSAAAFRTNFRNSYFFKEASRNFKIIFSFAMQPEKFETVCAWRTSTDLIYLSGDLHCNGNSVYTVFSFSGNSVASAPISTFMCLRAIYIFPGSVHIFHPAEKADPSWEYIIRSQTCTWMWKLWLRPRYSFSGNICFKFSAFCLCSVQYEVPLPMHVCRIWCIAAVVAGLASMLVHNTPYWPLQQHKSTWIKYTVCERKGLYKHVTQF